MGYAHGVALALMSLGHSTSLSSDRDMSSTETYFRESLALFREVGDQPNVAASLNNLGSILLDQGRPDEARTLLEESVQLYRQLGVMADFDAALATLGSVALTQGDLGRAASALAESLDVAHEMGDKQVVLFVLGYLAELATEQGFADRAARLAGAEAAGRNAVGSLRPPIDTKRLERAMSRARETLGADRFCDIWSEGQAMSLDEAVAYAVDQYRPHGHALR